MQLTHSKPCDECPWRTISAPGWLGGWPAEYYADAVAAGEAPACHLNDHGPENPRTSYCAGALATMRSSCVMPRRIEIVGARNSVQCDGVFSHFTEFYRHHADGENWVHPLARK